MKRCACFMLLACLLLLPAVLLNGAAKKSGDETTTFTLAGLGDCILGRRISTIHDPGFLKIVELTRKADCAWMNLEMPIVKRDAPGAYPAERDSLLMACPPWGADELKWLGIDTVGMANNHMMDFSFTGLFSTLEQLERVGISYAGAGKDLEHASKPGYADTPKTRVGQVSCAYWFDYGDNATLPHPLMRGRPGINPMRNTETVFLGKESYDHLRKIDRDISTLLQFPMSDKPQEIIYMDRIVFKEGKSLGYDDKLHKNDVKRFIQSVKTARNNAGIVIAAIHQHMGFDYKPSESIEVLARQCVDAGADVVFGTGPAKIWGIEIYKNKPIFYSLGNLFFHSEAFSVINPELYQAWGLPPDTRDISLFMDEMSKKVEYFAKDFVLYGIIPIITFQQGNTGSRVKKIELYPIMDTKNRPIYRQGTPVMAEGKIARDVIKSVIKRSRRYKTKIRFREGKGEIYFSP